MESDELFHLKQIKQHLTEWLRRYDTAQNIMPQVQANLNMTNWEVDALTNRPTVAGEIPSDLLHVLEHDDRFTRDAFPLMPKYDTVVSGTATSISTSGTASVYDYVAKYADAGIPEAADYSKKYTILYREIQNQQQRPDKVRELMVVFCSANTLQRFDVSKDSYLGTKSGATARTDAALAISNTLDGIYPTLASKNPTSQETLFSLNSTIGNCVYLG